MSASSTVSADGSLLQGLVFFERKEYGYALDSNSNYYIVITATVFEDKLPTDSDNIIFGAKLKLDEARLPIQVKLFQENIILKSTESAAWQNKDLVMSARICESGLQKYPCAFSESKLTASGIAKRLLLPGSDSAYFWTPVSLPLRPP